MSYHHDGYLFKLNAYVISDVNQVDNQIKCATGKFFKFTFNSMTMLNNIEIQKIVNDLTYNNDVPLIILDKELIFLDDTFASFSDGKRIITTKILKQLKGGQYVTY